MISATLRAAPADTPEGAFLPRKLAHRLQGIVVRDRDHFIRSIEHIGYKTDAAERRCLQIENTMVC
jgi:hypothetical protein